METPINAAHAWRTNADLIFDVAQLGYIKSTDRVLDPTFGRGVWWQKYRPNNLVTHDLAIDGVDFRALPHANDGFDVVAYDPPFVCCGGRKTTTMPDFANRYGLADAPSTPAALQSLMHDGLAECTRVVKPRGYILMKNQDYISGGKLWIGTHWTLTYALSIGLILVDRIEHLAGVRPQPPGRIQKHARRNLSTLFIFQKPRHRRKDIDAIPTQLEMGI